MWVYIHTCSNVICSTIIKMLTAYSAKLISCHLLSNILAGYIMCSHLLYQQCSEQDHLRTSQRGHSGLLGVRSPVSYLWSLDDPLLELMRTALIYFCYAFWLGLL